MSQIPNTIESFLSFVDKTTNSCWKWLGSISSHGYGQFTYCGKNWRAHRLSYWFFVDNTITEEDYLCHSCNNKWCVNPEHLVKGNASVNYEHARLCGRIPEHDQRFGRKNVIGKSLPKGIIYDSARNKYKCSIRVGDKRYQVRKNTLEDAILWRYEMEDKYWKQ